GAHGGQGRRYRMTKMPWLVRRPLPTQAKPEPKRNAIHRRDAEIAEISAEKTKTGWGEGAGSTRLRGWRAESAEEEESELRSDWQAEARPTKAVRAALGCTRRSLMPLATHRGPWPRRGTLRG